mmetsp:Transcript_46083/g.86009  ORF Transcript_46083/g.86009 Transcript_46083/m.86009 type:complete len:274 (-) Transcript_46083:1161-1982(-)
MESRPADIFLGVTSLVQGRCNELGVVNFTTPVHVNAIQELSQVPDTTVQLQLLHCRFHLLKGHNSIAVCVQSRKDILQLFDGLIVEQQSNGMQCCLLQFARLTECLHVADMLGLQRCPRRSGRNSADPLVRSRLLRCQACLRVQNQQAFYQIFCILGNRPPDLIGHAVATSLDEPDGILIISSSKRGFTTEENVHHHAARPQIACFVVFTSEDLGSHVVRRPSLGLQYMICPASQAHIDDFDHVYGAFGLQQEILRLQITVTNALSVHVADGP